MNNLSAEYLDKCRKQLLVEQTQSLADTSNWSHVDKQKVHADWDVLYKKLAPLVDQAQPDSVGVQVLVEAHFEIACRFYRPSREAYIGMALFYEENQNMKDFHNAYNPGMVAFMRRAMNVYAHQNLKSLTGSATQTPV